MFSTCSHTREHTYKHGEGDDDDSNDDTVGIATVSAKFITLATVISLGCLPICLSPARGWARAWPSSFVAPSARPRWPAGAAWSRLYFQSWTCSAQYSTRIEEDTHLSTALEDTAALYYLLLKQAPEKTLYLVQSDLNVTSAWRHVHDLAAGSSISQGVRRSIMHKLKIIHKRHHPSPSTDPYTSLARQVVQLPSPPSPGSPAPPRQC